MQRKEHRQDCPPAAGRQGDGQRPGQRASQRRPPEGGRYRINGRGNRGDGTASLRKTEAHRIARRGGQAVLRRAGLCHQVNGDCGGDVDARGSCGAALRSRAAGSQDELLPLCGSNSQAAPVPKLSVRRERWCGIDQFVSAFVHRRDEETVSLYFAHYF